MAASLAAIRDIRRSVQARADELLAVQIGAQQTGEVLRRVDAESYVV